jgi:hypothetical protein
MPAQEPVAVDGHRIVREPIDNGLVPRISAFYGIVVTMYWRDHPPAHFHAAYGGHVAKIAIDTLETRRATPTDATAAAPPPGRRGTLAPLTEPVSSTLARFTPAASGKSSSVGAVDQTAAPGAKGAPALRRPGD